MHTKSPDIPDSPVLWVLGQLEYVEPDKNKANVAGYKCIISEPDVDEADVSGQLHQVKKPHVGLQAYVATACKKIIGGFPPIACLDLLIFWS